VSERTVRLLEDRVERVARRIRELLQERERLRREVEALQSRLDAVEQEAARTKADADLDWSEIAVTLRAAAEELRRS
jgi:predicted ribosome quality control (RQC) complex YloA/Tae2 family protein